MPAVGDRLHGPGRHLPINFVSVINVEEYFLRNEVKLQALCPGRNILPKCTHLSEKMFFDHL